MGSVLFPRGLTTSAPCIFYSDHERWSPREFCCHLDPWAHLWRNCQKKRKRLQKGKRSPLATCVKTEGVKVVPIKSFFHPRRSTALHTSLKVAWTSKTLIHQLTMQAHLIRITFRLKKTAADNKSSFQTPEVLNTATDR